MVLNLELFLTFLKNGSEYIDPSSHLSFMKLCVAQTFLVKLYLDVVLKVLLVVGLDFKKK